MEGNGGELAEREEAAGTGSEHESQRSEDEGGHVSARIRDGGNTQRPPRPLILMGSLRETPGNSAGHAITRLQPLDQGLRPLLCREITEDIDRSLVDKRLQRFGLP